MDEAKLLEAARAYREAFQDEYIASRLAKLARDQLREAEDRLGEARKGHELARERFRTAALGNLPELRLAPADPPAPFPARLRVEDITVSCLDVEMLGAVTLPDEPGAPHVVGG
jgi:hypothetical protein